MAMRLVLSSRCCRWPGGSREKNGAKRRAVSEQHCRGSSDDDCPIETGTVAPPEGVPSFPGGDTMTGERTKECMSERRCSDVDAPPPARADILDHVCLSGREKGGGYVAPILARRR